MGRAIYSALTLVYHPDRPTLARSPIISIDRVFSSNVYLDVCGPIIDDCAVWRDGLLRECMREGWAIGAKDIVGIIGSILSLSSNRRFYWMI